MSSTDTGKNEGATSQAFNRVAENLYKHEQSGNYYALIKRSGKQIRRSLKTKDVALAKRRLAGFKAKVFRLDQNGAGKKLTFDDLSEQWLTTQKSDLKEKSAARIETCIKGLRPFFRGQLIRSITRLDCEQWKIKRGDALSPSSYKHERRVLIALFDYSISHGLVLENPAKDLRTRTIGKAKIIIPTKEQFRLLVQTIRQADARAQHAANLVELLGYSGMRLGEAINLLWEDVDWERGLFTVTGGERGTKNHNVRTVPLFPAMRELLGRIMPQDAGPSARVIPIACAQTAIINACKKAKLPHFLHHSMRHYFCSNAIEAGVDFKVIAGWLGHSDGGILVAQTYGHLRDAHSLEMAKRMTFSAVAAAADNVVCVPVAAA